MTVQEMFHRPRGLFVVVRAFRNGLLTLPAAIERRNRQRAEQRQRDISARLGSLDRWSDLCDAKLAEDTSLKPTSFTELQKIRMAEAARHVQRANDLYGSKANVWRDNDSKRDGESGSAANHKRGKSLFETQSAQGAIRWGYAAIAAAVVIAGAIYFFA